MFRALRAGGRAHQDQPRAEAARQDALRGEGDAGAPRPAAHEPEGPFSGRLARRALAAGLYRGTISATDLAGNRSSRAHVVPDRPPLRAPAPLRRSLSAAPVRSRPLKRIAESWRWPRSRWPWPRPREAPRPRSPARVAVQARPRAEPLPERSRGDRRHADGKTRIERPKRAKQPADRLLLRLPDHERAVHAQRNLLVDKELTNVALGQASRFSQACRVFAPVYRQVTLAGILGRFPGAPAAGERDRLRGRGLRLARVPQALQPRPRRGADRALAGRGDAQAADHGKDRSPARRAQAPGVGGPARRERGRAQGS